MIKIFYGPWQLSEKLSFKAMSKKIKLSVYSSEDTMSCTDYSCKILVPLPGSDSDIDADYLCGLM